MDAATRRLGSLVDDSATTVKRTCPGFRLARPSSRSTSSQLGGKIELTRTRLKLARWASRSAISKLVSFSLCRPTPLVRNALVGMNMLESINPSPSGARVGWTASFRKPHPGTGLDRGLRFAAPVRRGLHHLGHYLRRREADLLHLHPGLPAVLAAHDQHVARGVDPQPPLGGALRHHRRSPLPPLPLDRPEEVNGLDVRRRHLRFHRRRELDPPRALARRGA